MTSVDFKPEEFKKVFRFYKGETECPYTQETPEQRHWWAIWNMEQCLAKADKERILKYATDIDAWCDPLFDAEVSDMEKVCARYIQLAGDGFFADQAFVEYFSYPIVYEIKD